MSWKLVALAPKPVVQTALAAHEAMEAMEEWDPELVLTGSEIAESRPDDWQLEVYFPRRPLRADRKAVADLFAGNAPRLTVQKLPDTDWVSETQKAVAPIRGGRFHVHTPDFPTDETPGVVDFIIPASQAFGTGQHATTAGCLAMLHAMKRRGMVVRNHADIGTGTGLLGFAALNLWPRSYAIGSDIDIVCEIVVEENARLNGITIGASRGELEMVTAEGMEHDALLARAPYDLLMANILAGPLVTLAGDFADAVAPRGSVLLAGLLETQEPAVRAAYYTAGFRLAARLVIGDWSILWLRRRPLA